MPRYFFGVDVPVDVKAQLRAIQQTLRAAKVEANGWSNPDLLHVTTLFIGMVDASVEPVLREAGAGAAAAVAPFQLITGTYGVFARNKVLWLGFDEKESDLDALSQLHDSLLTMLTDRVPVELDPRPYRAHLTLARKLRDATRLRKVEAPPKFSIPVHELCLFESVRVDGGPLTYPIRVRFPLQTAAVTPNGSSQSE